MPHPQFTGARNELNEAGWRELGRLVRAGTETRDMAAALGLSLNHAGRLAKKARDALGLKHPLVARRDALVARIDELLRAGGTNLSVARDLGIDAKTVSIARRELGLAQPSHLRLTPEEYAEVDRRLIAGERPRAIAAAIGTHIATVSKRAAAIRHLIPDDFPPCRCGRPHNHTGACRLEPEKVAYIRKELAAGRRMEWIGPEVGLSIKQLREYALPMIAELRAQGVKCPCGRDVSHKPPCPQTHRWPIDPEFQAQVRVLLEQGMARLTIAKHLDCSFPKVNRAARPILAEMAAGGVTCACGQPIDHPKGCAARGVAPGFKGYVFSRAARTIPLDKRYRAANLAKAGHGNKAICDKLGLNEYGVTALIKDLAARGRLPEYCICGHAYGHRGGCRPVVKVKAPSRINGSSRPKRPDIGDGALMKRMFDQWRKGMSVREISRASGLPLSTVQRLGAYWRSRKTKPAMPCACGLPAHHPGGCIRNTPAAVTKLEKARIIDATRAGELPHRIAERMGLTVQTVMRHSAATRDELFAAGISCACGRPLGHNYWCSAKWDAFDRPRGRRPFPKQQESQAVEALLRGDVVGDIACAVGFSPDSIWRLRRTLSEDQRAQRARAIRARIAESHRSGGMAVMDQIKAAVSKRIDPVLRDDVIAELYLAVVEGRVEVEQIAAVARSFVNRGISEWQSAYGPRSLDEKLPGDGNRTLADGLGDTTASLAVDEIEIGQLPP